MNKKTRAGAKAILDCLKYLQEEAIDLDLEMTARLIGATVEELHDTLLGSSRTQTRGDDEDDVHPKQAGNVIYL